MWQEGFGSFISSAQNSILFSGQHTTHVARAFLAVLLWLHSDTATRSTWDALRLSISSEHQVTIGPLEPEVYEFLMRGQSFSM